MTLRASSLGSCLRSLVAQELGYSTVEPPAVVQGWFDRGTAHEAECIDAMRADGWTITDQQREVEWGGVSGHLDGLCVHADHQWGDMPGQAVLEVKAPSAHARFEKAYKTADWSDPYMHIVGVQLSVYQLAMGMEAVVACYDGERVRWFAAETPPFNADYIQGRIEQINAFVMCGNLPGCSQRDFPCPVRYLCDEAQEARTVIDDPTLVAQLTRFHELGQQATAVEKERKAIRAAIELPPGRYTAGTVELTISKVAGRSSLDEEKLRADGVDVDAYRVTSAPSVRWKTGNAQ